MRVPDATFGEEAFASRIGQTTVASVTISALLFVAGVAVARFLGPEARGELAAIQLWGSLLATVGVLGLPDAVLYFSSRHPESSRSTAVSATSWTVGLAVVLMALGFLLMPLLLHDRSGPTISAARFYLLFLLANALLVTPSQALRGLDRFGLWNAMRTGPAILWAIVVAGAWITGRADPAWIAFAFLAGFYVLAVVGVPWVFSILRGPWRGGIKTKEMFRFSLPSGFAVFPHMLNLRLDQLLLAALFPPAALGAYVVSVTWSNATQPVVAAFGYALFPSVATVLDETERKETFLRRARIGITLAAVSAVLLALLTPWGFVQLFGASFRDAVPVATILALSGVFLGTNVVLEEGLRGLGRPGSVVVAELSGVAITGLGLILLLGPYGITGAALATFAGYLTTSLVALREGARAVDAPMRALARPDLPGLISSVRSAFGSWRTKGPV